MVVEPVSEIPNATTSISVPASNSIVLPSKKVIWALESSPDFTISPASRDIPTCASVQLSAPAFITNTSPSVIESIVSVEGVTGPSCSSGVVFDDPFGISPFDGSWPRLIKTKVTGIDTASTATITISNSFLFLRMVGLL